MSDQTTSIFGNESPPVTQVTNQAPSQSQTPSPSDPVADLLGQIRNERGEPKYKTVQDALNGLLHAQNHIQTLLNEKRQVSEELETLKPVATKVEELQKVVERLTQPQQPPITQPVTPQGLTEEQVAKLVETTLTRAEQERLAKQNLGSVVTAVKGVFGDKAEEVFYKKAEELGLDKASINALAARTPQAALRLLGIDATSNSAPSTQTSSVNTTNFSHNQTSFIGRNTRKLEVGATHQEIQQEAVAARKMVEELNQKGMSIDDLTKPSNYFKYFSN